MKINPIEEKILDILEIICEKNKIYQYLQEERYSNEHYIKIGNNISVIASDSINVYEEGNSFSTHLGYNNYHIKINGIFFETNRDFFNKVSYIYQYGNKMDYFTQMNDAISFLEKEKEEINNNISVCYKK